MAAYTEEEDKPKTAYYNNRSADNRPEDNSSAERFWRHFGKRQSSLEEDLKRERRNTRWAQISDAIAAVGNFVSVAHGGPNAFDPSQMAGPKARARYDAVRAKMDAHKDNMLAGYEKAKALDEARQLHKANYELQRQQLEDNKERYKEQRDETERHNREMERLTQGRMDTSAENNIRSNDARIAIAQMRAAAKREGNPGPFTWYDAEGNAHDAKTYKEMESKARAAGTWTETEVEYLKTTTDRRGRVVKTEQSRRGGGTGYSAPTGGGKKTIPGISPEEKKKGKEIPGF